MPRQQLPAPGQVVLLTRAASVQFTHPIRLRIIRVHDWATYTGWCWLDGYQLDGSGVAVSRRSVFVQLAGLIRVDPPTRPGNR